MEYVLAMYDIRGKQDFIFRTNKLKEIAGGSWIIRDVFEDYLFPAARKVGGREVNGKKAGEKGIYYYKDKAVKETTGAEFSPDRFEKHMSELDKSKEESEDESTKESDDDLKGGYLGEVIYDGGGNFLLLYKNEEIFREVTYEFTKSLMESIGTLRVLGTCVEIKNFDDYKADRKRLYAAHRANEMEESMISPWSCLPIVQVDRATSQPLVYVRDKSGLPYKLQAELSGTGEGMKPQKFSKECLAKRRKFYDVMQKAEKEKGVESSDGSGQSRGNTAERYFHANQDVFDRMIEKKGEDSLLAVVYIDGNSMGAKVQTCLGELCKYEDCIRALRGFSEEIQTIYIEDGVNAAMEGKTPDQAHRIVIYAGDEINFVVNAHDAYRCAKNYLDKLPKGHSACAGIAVFHSHSPYAEAYRIAEECCESGKQRMKEAGIAEADFIDFHTCQGVTGTSLEQIRETETGGALSRPWVVRIDEADVAGANDLTNIKDIERLIFLFRYLGRSNVKDLADRAVKGCVELSMELMRIYAHLPEEKKRETEEIWKWIGVREGAPVSEKMRWMIYDVVQGYDLWFSGERFEAGEFASELPAAGYAGANPAGEEG